MPMVSTPCRVTAQPRPLWSSPQGTLSEWMLRGSESWLEKGLVRTLDSSQHRANTLRKAGRELSEGFGWILMVRFALEITDSLGPN